LAIGVLVAAGIWRVWPHERLLTEMAHPVMEIKTKNEKAYWLSNNRLLILTTTQRSNEDAVRRSSAAPQYWKGYADILNLDTGTKTRLSGLTDLLNRKTAIPENRTMPWTTPEKFEMSPNGQWLLWQINDDYHDWYWLRVAHIDGTHVRAWDSSPVFEHYWQDSRHLIQLEPLGTMIVTDLQDPAKDRSYWLPGQTSDTFAQHLTQHPLYIGIVYPQTPFENYVEIDTGRMQDHIQFYEEEAKQSHTLQKRKIKLPEGAYTQEVVVSPQQTAIFYHLQKIWISPVSTWLYRILPKFYMFYMKPILTEELWISRADGSDLHEIGHVPTSMDKTGNPAFQLHALHWLPDGKHISFVAQGRLYVVPAEPGK